MRLVVLLLMTVLISCSKENEYNFDTAVEDELKAYFIRFQEEAEIRGKYIDWTNEEIYARIEAIDGDASGRCLTYGQGSHEILIDEEYWTNNNELNREFIIFHELGHCLLGRGHLDLSFANGTCVSVMNSGQSVCKKNFNRLTRSMYLDELFSN